MTAPPTRKVIHVDMDAFYASVEQRDHPHLRGIPLAVAWGGPRSVVLTASYEARPYGVRSAMPTRTALARCPHLTLAEPRFEAYREVSGMIRTVFARYTDCIEPLSLDEAYLDVTESKSGERSATRIAQAIKADIVREAGLSATAGVSVNKFLAKLASGMNKPDGLTVILLHQVDALLAGLDIEAFHGVGPATAAKLRARGIRSGADLRACPLPELAGQFGKFGEHLYRVARGQDDRPVEADRASKSIGAEETYPTDLRGVEAVRAALLPLAETVARRLAREGLAGQVVVLKLKYADFTVQTRRLTVSDPVQAPGELCQLAAQLCTPELLVGRGVRLVGITAAGLVAEGRRGAQPGLFRVG